MAGVYESPLSGLDKRAVQKALGDRPKVRPPEPEGKCSHIPVRPVHKRVKIRDSGRLMQFCKECYEYMDHAGCIGEVVL